LNIPLIADWHLIAQRREKKSSMKAYVNRTWNDADMIILWANEYLRKYTRTEGPYTIVTVHVNGTITIELSPGVTERNNVRRVVPYRETAAAWFKSTGLQSWWGRMSCPLMTIESWVDWQLLEICRVSKMSIELIRGSRWYTTSILFFILD
jgi:hypothetical protein